MCAQDKTINITSLLTSTPLWPCGNVDATSTTSSTEEVLGYRWRLGIVQIGLILTARAAINACCHRVGVVVILVVQ